MEEQQIYEYNEGDEYTGDTEAGAGKKRKRPFLKGFLCGIATTLIITIAGLAVTTTWLSSNGFVLTTFELDEELTADVLSEPIQSKIAELLSALSQYFYQDLDNSAMAEGLYKGLVDSLGDPYTTYYTVQEYEDYTSSISGIYYGIGAVLLQDINTREITITRVYDGSPAQEAGLKAGDVFVSAAGIEAAGLEVSEFVTYIKGAEGTTVDLVVKRDGEELSFTVERRKVKVLTIESKMLENKVGYIQILEFNAGTTEEFESALKELKVQGMKSLIVDLRDNPGGMLDVVADILDDILPEGLLVYTEDKYGNRSEYTSSGKEELGMPLVVLVNENSASASEIFAGAIKDFEYGTILGTTTFGKGIVQVVLPLSDGSAVKVTTAKYYTPNGNYIHGVGIEPDVELEFEYQGDDNEAYDIMKDNQVLKALEILKQ